MSKTGVFDLNESTVEATSFGSSFGGKVLLAWVWFGVMRRSSYRSWNNQDSEDNICCFLFFVWNVFAEGNFPTLLHPLFHSTDSLKFD